MNNLFDKKYLIKCLLGLVSSVILMKVTHGNAFALAFVLLWKSISTNNNELLLYTILSTIALTMSNPAIVVKGNNFLLIQRCMMITIALIMMTRIIRLKLISVIKSYLCLFAYLIFMVFSSIFGWNPWISFLKLILFSLVYIAFLGLTVSLTEDISKNDTKIRSIFLSFAIYFILGSLLLIPSSLGYMSGENAFIAMNSGIDIVSLFMGISFQAQSLGAICTMIGVFLYADLLFSVRYPNKLYMLLLGCVPILIWKSSSRTAMLSFVFGIF